MGERILCLNRGSSSLKFALYESGDDGEKPLAAGAVEGIGTGTTRSWIRVGREEPRDDGRVAAGGAREPVAAVFEALASRRLDAPTAVGHRIVHGGPDLVAPTLVDDRVSATLRAAVPFAPLHLPAELEGIAAVTARHPRLPQVVCFDTAFHARMPAVARRLPLPRAMWDAGIRRYGFHGLSYEYVVGTIGAATLGRAVVAHLGNGASLAAIRDGQSVDTTMGLTPAGGIVMGTRTGDLDPGVLTHLLAHRGYDVAALERLVDRESGLLGVSGTSADMRQLLAVRARDPHAAEAVDLFCYDVRKQIGAFAAVLGGIDTLVFTGGIGEHAAPVRWEVCQGLEHIGIRIDAARNDVHAPVISPAAGRCLVRVVPTDEDLMIARHTRRVLDATRA
jgi:acetate kinase